MRSLIRQWLEGAPWWTRPFISVGWSAYSRARAMLSRSSQRHYCRALAGLSDYNLCINSDMSVSCNCQDFSGMGRLGDLKSQTLEQVLTGPTARSFQERLLAGQYPTDVCPRCDDLASAEADMTIDAVYPGRLPTGGIMVENTARCNLRCALCDREAILASRSQPSLSFEDVAEIASTLTRCGIEKVSYFNLGEPFLSPHILEEVRILREACPDVELVTSTNGLALGAAHKMEAAMMMDYICYSLDGVDQTSAERYQQGTDYEKAFDNLRQLVEERERRRSSLGPDSRTPTIEWKYVLFRWNNRARHIRKAIELAKALRVDMIAFYPGGAPLGSRSFRHLYDRSLRAAEWRPDGSAALRVSNLKAMLLVWWNELGLVELATLLEVVPLAA